VIERIERGEGDFFAVSLPAADVLASQGNEKAAIEAMQFIDTCLGGIIDKILEVNGTAIVTSPNGLVNESLDDAPGDVRVPFHLISNNAEEQKLRKNGTLSDIAPTILAILGFGKSAEMSGNDLRSC
jgi:2,3-bisphosphoglycerate-independent phosphoglycerate mutase